MLYAHFINTLSRDHYLFSSFLSSFLVCWAVQLFWPLLVHWARPSWQNFSLQEFFSLKASESQIGQLIIIYICLLYQKVLVKSTRKGTCFNWEITINFSYTNLVNLLRKIFVNGKKDNSVEGGSSYDGMSGKTQIGTWWSGNNGLKTNVEIDNLYIIDKAIQYSPTDQQLCYARAINLNTP